MEANLEGALSEEPRPGVERKLIEQGGGAFGGDRLLKAADRAGPLDLELLADEMVRLTDA